jgi:ABC-2 type transport system permease protein
MNRILRIVARGWVFQLKILAKSSFFFGAAAVQPLILATIGVYLFKAGHREGLLLWLAIGAAFVGIWATTIFGSGSAIADQRFQGTLEIIVAAPAPLITTVLPITLASASIGLYALLATLFWGWLLLGVPLTLVHPWWFVVSVPATVFSLGALGLVISGIFVLYRYANALSNMLEVPVWLLSGLLLPVAKLPAWTHVISYVLAPSWGVQAIRDSAIGGHPLGPVLGCLGLAVVYLVTGTSTLRYIERRACRHGTLALA